MEINCFFLAPHSNQCTSLVAQMVKKSVCNVGDPGLIPGSGRTPGEEHGNRFTFLAWEIPWTEEPGGL